jgi:hypothetical protein
MGINNEKSKIRGKIFIQRSCLGNSFRIKIFNELILWRRTFYLIPVGITVKKLKIEGGEIFINCRIRLDLFHKARNYISNPRLARLSGGGKIPFPDKRGALEGVYDYF